MEGVTTKHFIPPNDKRKIAEKSFNFEVDLNGCPAHISVSS